VTTGPLPPGVNGSGDNAIDFPWLSGMVGETEGTMDTMEVDGLLLGVVLVLVLFYLVLYVATRQ
jgi:hypothetical protein